MNTTSIELMLLRTSLQRPHRQHLRAKHRACAIEFSYSNEHAGGLRLESRSNKNFDPLGHFAMPHTRGGVDEQLQLSER